MCIYFYYYIIVALKPLSAEEFMLRAAGTFPFRLALLTCSVIIARDRHLKVLKKMQNS